LPALSFAFLIPRFFLQNQIAALYLIKFAYKTQISTAKPTETLKNLPFILNAQPLSDL
jgi:hypothetical protein